MAKQPGGRERVFDWTLFATFLRDGIMRPRGMWEEYFRKEHDWRETALHLFLPMLLLTALLVPVLSTALGAPQVLGADSFGWRGFLSGAVGTIVAMGMLAGIISFTAGWFGGQAGFDRGFAAVVLTSVPAFVADVVGTVPQIGWAIEIVGSVTSIVFLYLVIPLALGVPQKRRLPHFAVSLVGAVLVGVVLNSLVGGNPSD